MIHLKLCGEKQITCKCGREVRWIEKINEWVLSNRELINFFQFCLFLISLVILYKVRLSVFIKEEPLISIWKFNLEVTMLLIFIVFISIFLIVILFVAVIFFRKEKVFVMTIFKFTVFTILNIVIIFFLVGKFIYLSEEATIPQKVMDMLMLSNNSKINYSIYKEKKEFFDIMRKIDSDSNDNKDNKDILSQIGTLLVISIEEGGKKINMDDILNFLKKNKIRGLFVSKNFINTVDTTNSPKGVQYLLEEFKKRCRGYVYSDIYPNTLMKGIKYILPQLALSTIHNLDITYKSAYDYGRNIKENLLVDIVLEPSVDRAISAYDSQLRTRTFGSDNEEIFLNAFSFIRGLNDAGIFTLIKHFPSHPQIENKNNNSERTEALSYYSIETLRSNAEVFYKLIFNPYIDTAGFLTDHVHIIGWGKNSNLPYTVVDNGLKRLVEETKPKKNFSFTPISITDDLCRLSIRKIKATYCNEATINKLVDNSIKALKSGHDLILVRHLSLDSARLFFNTLKSKLFKYMEEDPLFKKELATKIARVEAYYEFLGRLREKSFRKPVVESSTEVEELYKKAFIRLNLANKNIFGKSLSNLLQEADNNKSNRKKIKILFVSQFIKKDDFLENLKSYLSNKTNEYNVFYIALKRKGSKLVQIKDPKHCEVGGNDYTVATLLSFIACISAEYLESNCNINIGKGKVNLSKIKSYNVTPKEITAFLNTFDYIVVSVNDWYIVPTIKTIYHFLNDKKKLIIIFMDSPNCMFDSRTQIGRSKYLKEYNTEFYESFLDEISKLQPAEILLNTSSFYICKNDKYSISSFTRLEFNKFKPLSYLTIDIPNFYYYNGQKKYLLKRNNIIVSFPTESELKYFLLIYICVMLLVSIAIVFYKFEVWRDWVFLIVKTLATKVLPEKVKDPIKVKDLMMKFFKRNNP